MRNTLFLVAALAATAASAQPFKCTNEEGKTVYSDQRCDALPTKPAPAAGADAKKGGRYQPTAEDLERIKALEAEAVKHGVSSERKTALLLEASGIRSGTDARMTAEDRSKRDVISGRLTSKDVKTRTEALGDLRNLYGHY
jgi:hypothetical protein